MPALVLTLVSFGPERQSIPEAAFRADATIVAVDYDMCVPASLATGAALFLTDDRDQFLANRTETQFVGYPEPMAMIGEAIAAGTPRPDGPRAGLAPGRRPGRCRLRRRHPAGRRSAAASAPSSSAETRRRAPSDAVDAGLFVDGDLALGQLQHDVVALALNRVGHQRQVGRRVERLAIG